MARTLTPPEIYQLALKHGFSPQDAVTVTAIAGQESQGNTGAFNPKDSHGGSVGLMQINGANAGLIGGANWKSVGQDPDASMAAAHALFERRGNFKDWGGYTDGGYKKYYNQALDASRGTTLNSVPASAMPPPPDAYGYSHSPGTENAPTGTPAPTATPAPAAPPAEQSPWDKWLKKPEPTVDKDGKPVQGKSKIEQLVDSFSDDKGRQPLAPPPQMQQAMPVQDPTAQMAGPAAQLFAQVQAASAKPLTWSSKPYGWNAGQQMGTTLNSVNPYG